MVSLTAAAGRASPARLDKLKLIPQNRRPAGHERRPAAALILGIAGIVGEADTDTMQESAVVRRG